MTTLSALLSTHGTDVARLHDLWGSFALDGPLVHYERNPARDLRPADICGGLEDLACRLEDDGWDLVRVSEGDTGADPASPPIRLSFLRVTGRTEQRTDVDPWDDVVWCLRAQRLRREREARGRGKGPAEDPKRAGAMARHRATRWADPVEMMGEREQAEAEASDGR